jgi:hypothetical protein
MMIDGKIKVHIIFLDYPQSGMTRQPLFRAQVSCHNRDV